MIRKRKKINWYLVLFWVIASGVLLSSVMDANAQGRIRDKVTETNLTGTELLGMDRSDYGNIKKVSTGAFRTWVLNGLTIDNIGGVNTSGSSDGKILKYLNGILVVADDATGGSGGGAVVISDLTDVNTAGMVTNQILKYNGTTHIPWTINLENIRALGNTFAGNVNFADINVNGAAIFYDDIKITLDAGAGKVLTSDAAGNATWEDPAASVLQAGNGIRLDPGGSPGQVEVNLYPYALPVVTDPSAANVSFAIDYAGDERKLGFQQTSILMLQDQTFMAIYPETSIVLEDALPTLDICTIDVTLTDGEGSTIPIASSDQSDFTLTGNYCTPYFDDIESNEYRFCVYQFNTLPVGESYHVTVTHTPSGVSKTWHLEVWGGGAGGGIGIGSGDVTGEMIADGAISTAKLETRSVTADKIYPESIEETHMSSDVIIQLVKTVSAWPSPGGEPGIYWKKGEGMRYYYTELGVCSWKYEKADGTSYCVQVN